MHYVSCVVGHSMVVCLDVMTMDVRDSAFELSTNVSSCDSECEFLSPSVKAIDGTNVVGVSLDTSSHESIKVHKQSQHFRDDHDDILLCAGL